MFSYASHGLSIRSELRLPELPALEEGGKSPDVTVRLGDLPDAPNEQTYHERTPEEIRFSVPEAGTVRVREGREILVDPADGATDAVVRLLVLGPSLGSLLLQRGTLVLHGSGLSIDGRAVVLLGPSGAGKSTTAAALANRGHDVITDDHVVVTEGERPSIQPAFPSLKLEETTVDAFGLEWPLVTDALDSFGKAYYRPPSRTVDGPIPIDTAYLLAGGEELTIEPIEGSDAVITLVGNTYAPHLLPDIDLTDGNFQQCARVAEHVRLRRLQRVDDVDRIGEVVRAIERDVADA